VTIRSFTLNVTAPATDQVTSWNQRSTGPGVVWAHNFEYQAELNQFLFSPGSAFPHNANEPFLPKRYSAPQFGPTAGMVGERTWATTLAEPLPPVPENTMGSIRVTDASVFPDPATHYNGWYELLIGKGASEGYNQESIRVYSINYATNTLTSVLRGEQLSSGSLTHTPDFPAGFPIGHAPSARWNRLMLPLVAGQNGLPFNDRGIAAGYNTKTWTQSTTNYGIAHGRFRGGWWGHPAAHAKYHAQWPPADTSLGWEGASATNGTPLANCFAHNDPNMCSEFWIQYRMKIPAAKFNDTPCKLMYLQTANMSTPQQLFHSIDTSGSYEDRLVLAYNFNGPVFDFASVMSQPGWHRYVPDEWVTYMIHVIPGRGVREWPEYPGTGANQGGAAEGTIEMFAARQNESTFTKFCSTTIFKCRYGYPPPDGSYNTNPPAYNAFNPTNYPNHYPGSGSSGAALTNSEVLYAQVILSRFEIPCPPPLV
jgi:hypothetical protein